MKAPWCPPTYRRLLVVTGVLSVVGALAAAGLIVATRRQVVIGSWGLLLVAPSWATVLWCFYSAIVAKRARRRVQSFPGGLCPGCEHPLPDPCDDPVTCTECGLCLPRAEHRKPWARWVGELK